MFNGFNSPELASEKQILPNHTSRGRESKIKSMTRYG